MKRVFLLVAGTLSGLLWSPSTAQVSDSLAIHGTGFEVDVYGSLFVVDSESNLLAVYSPGKQVSLRQVGGQGWGNDQFDRPLGLWARNGIDVFVADYGNHRIQRFDRNLNFVSSFFTRDDEDPGKRFGYPADIALSRLGDLFICDTENSRILKVNGLNKVERAFGGFDAGNGRLYSPKQVEVGGWDNVFVLDRARILVFDVFGNFLYTLGEQLFESPSVLFADQDGVMVLDGNLLYSFDENGRSGRMSDILELVNRRFHGEDVRAMTYAKGVLYFLTEKGITVLNDPGVRGKEKAVDKEKKSR